jgi:hypothetical protein
LAILDCKNSAKANKEGDEDEEMEDSVEAVGFSKV